MNEQKIQKLLGLLELSDEDFRFHHLIKQARKYVEPMEVMAFRLRDEAQKECPVEFRRALQRVYTYDHCRLCGQYEKATWHITDYKLWRWAAAQSKPQRWIVSSLIAKELK